jgi:hypothetical protein
VEPLDGIGQPFLAPDVLFDHPAFLLGNDFGHLADEPLGLFLGQTWRKDEPGFVLSHEDLLMVLSPFLIWKEQGDKDILYTKTAIIQAPS